MSEWIFEKYIRVKTGEVLLVAPHPYNDNYIFIKRNNKYYKQPKSIIGNTILPFTPSEIIIGSKVTVCPEKGGVCEKYEIVAPIVEYEYKGMGGAYYGAKTKVKKTVDRDENSEYFRISAESTLAKKILGLRIGAKFEMPDENGNDCVYVITEIINQD